jgi:hypothetical protein
MRRAAYLGLLTLLLSASVSATSVWGAAESEYLVLSTGIESCGAFIQRTGTSKEFFLAFAVGYITGANSHAVGMARFVGKGWDKDAMTVWLQNYCNANPLSPFVAAVEELRTELAKKQGVPNP